MNEKIYLIKFKTIIINFYTEMKIESIKLHTIDNSNIFRNILLTKNRKIIFWLDYVYRLNFLI